MDGLEQGWGLDLIAGLQHALLPGLAPFCALFHVLGSEWFYLLALPLVYWCGDSALGRRLAVRFLLSVWLNAFAKWALLRPRPSMVGPSVEPLFTDGSPGLPSGHAQQAALVYGSLAQQSRRRAAVPVAVVLTLLMAFSRMLAGMHYLQDVLGGIVLGLLLLTLLPRAEVQLLPWLRQLSLRRQVEFSAIVVAVLALVTRGLATLRPSVVHDTIKPLAMLLGLLMGFAFERAWVRFIAPETLPKRLISGVVGLGSMIALYFGLAKLPGAELDAVRFARYTLLGLWIAAGVPWLLLRTGLSQAAPSDH